MATTRRKARRARKAPAAARKPSKRPKKMPQSCRKMLSRGMTGGKKTKAHKKKLMRDVQACWSSHGR